MQYNKDIKGKFSDIFIKLRNIFLSYSQIKEIKNAKQTSYHDEYGVIVMMRDRGDTLVVAFGKGSKLQEKYPCLVGSGKIVRHLHFNTLDEVDEILIREMLEESFILGMESFEMKRLKGIL